MKITLNLPSILLLTTLVFFVLRITGTTQWSFVWVFSPLWAPIVAPIVAFCLFGALLSLFFLVMLLIRYIRDFMTGRV